MGEISNYGQCSSCDVNTISDDAWVLELEDIEKNTAKVLRYFEKKDRVIKGVQHRFKQGELLFSKLRTYLNKVFVAQKYGYCSTEIIPVSFFSNIAPKYICFVLKSNYFLQYSALCGYGVKMPRIGTADALHTFIPLPPINEQRRIISKVESCFLLADRIDEEKKKLEIIIKIFKTKILSLAINGNLVPQNKNDEPAIELLKKINPNFKPCDNSHYKKIPKGWSIVPLAEILDYEQPQPYIVDSENYSQDYSVPVLTAGKKCILGYTNEEYGICTKLPVILFDDFTTDSRYIDFPFKVKSSAVKILHAKQGINAIYVGYFMNITNLVSKTHKRYWISEYSKVCMPLPPRKEQNQIVNIVKMFFSQLDKLMQCAAN